jgi:outer membrane immunogenic protein
MSAQGKIASSTALIAVAAASTGSALAGDLPVRAPAPPPDPAPTWQGFYVGGSLGATWLNSVADDSGALISGYGGSYPILSLDSGSYGANETGSRTTASGVGWLAGGQAGYNLEDRNFVVGVEADISWLGSTKATASGTHGVTQEIYNYGTHTLSSIDNTIANSRTSQLEALATFRARFGIDLDGTLPYVTAGLALGDIKNSYSASAFGAGPIGISSSTWAPGIALGGGVEHMFGNHWTIRGEVLWVGFKDVNLNVAGVEGYSSNTSGNVRFSDNVVLAKISMNYKF